jgi:hypothetical protein
MLADSIAVLPTNVEVQTQVPVHPKVSATRAVKNCAVLHSLKKQIIFIGTLKYIELLRRA